MSKKELVYNPKTGSFDKVTAKNSKKKSNEYNPKTGSFEREPQKKLKSKKKEKVDRSKKSQEVTKVLNSNYKPYVENKSSSNLKELPNTIIGLLIFYSIGTSIVFSFMGDDLFSGHHIFVIVFATIISAIVAHNTDYAKIDREEREEKEKKRIKKAEEEKNKERVRQENTTKSTDVSSGSGGSGTAFFIDNKGHVITNNHVVKGFENRAKIFYDNEDVKLKFIACDEQLDLALLKANVQNEDYIDIADKVVKKMQNIVAAGYPLGKHLSDDLKFTSGIVSSLKGPGNNSAIMQIDAALNPGNSGGPIVDKENGHLAGVAVAGLRKDVTEGINYGIKASRVKEFLQSNRITLKSKNDLSEKIDVGERLENATVYISCE